MKRSLLVIGFVVLFVLAGAYEVKACRCFGRTSFQQLQGNQTCGYYSGADAVFVGVAEKIETDQANLSVKVTFSVEKPIRGTSGKRAEILTSTMCGYPFEQGERYFVYGRKGQDGNLTEGMCGPTVKLKDARDDLEYVEELAAGKLGTRFSGSVIQDKQGVEYDQRNDKPLPDIEITIRSAKKTYKTRTDENGVYVFKDFPKDTYRVSAELPHGVREINPQVYQSSQFANPCGGKIFRVSSKGSISGKVVGFPTSEIENVGDKKSAQPQLTLIPLDDQAQPVKLASPFRQEWAFREKFEYSFNNIPAGKYLLAMNPRNCPYPNNGIGPMYYPGAATKEEAKIVTVKEGQQLVLNDFRSLPALKARWIAGKVVDRDGSSVASAHVRLTAGPFETGGCWRSDFRADEQGRFRIKGFETYRYEIWVGIEVVDGNPRGFKKIRDLPENSPVDELVLILDQQ